MLLGGLIGIRVINPATGAMFNLTPAQIDAALVKTVKHGKFETISELTPELRVKAPR